ncbi:hypothetical protein [Nostoc sp. PA-18-2419]|uniref:hypothetical protein n=1 Tax=Nostoc sp. PA-18-2419 TaxID=2575443 RepID=UPI001CB99A01|nr:hypothetical protein [Nostoc sp. PA-18-2419]
MSMEAFAINSINNEVNTLNANGSNNLYNANSFAANGSLYTEGSQLTGGNNLFIGNGGGTIPGSGINPFAGEAGGKLQQLIFDRLKLILGDNFFKDIDKTLAGGSNPFLTGGNPILDSGNVHDQSPFDPLREVLGNNIPFSNSGNTSNIGSPPFNQDNAPIGNANRNFGNNNAIIGNFNSDYGNDSATIGNGNWNFNNDNATIGNGNWLFAKDNTTLGNGNWYWDNGSNNATLGNGNWHFGTDNSTIGNGNWHFGDDNTSLGNGNWDFGSNNTIIGNGNWVFTSGNTIIGNGNWLENSDNTTIGNVNSPELFSQGVRTDVNNLIDSLIGRIGQDFTVLTGDFDVSSTQTYNRLISSRSNNISDSDISNNIQRVLASLSMIPGNQPVQNPQSVPESTSSVPLLVMAVVCLLLSIFKKQQHC